jgi:hypothetical protein
MKHVKLRSSALGIMTCAVALSGCPREPPPASWFEPSTPSSTAARGADPSSPKAAAPFVSCEKTPVNELIRVDQFGYRPDSKKVAVLADPVEGFNANQELAPGRTYEVRSWTDGKVVFSGAPQVWNGGAVSKSSGDRGFWFDFSIVQNEGSYCVVDREGGFRSHRFQIGRAAYRDVLKAALKVFYFQRANQPKQKPYACAGDKCWEAAAAYVGPRQDKEARSVTDQQNPQTARDLSGGWWDAGDVNKYVSFAQPAVNLLLTAYSDRPATFTDDFGIPESGNGIPDILDELKVELDWFIRMQPPELNGGVLPKVGNADHGDPIPEKSTFPRFYYPKPCSTSTISAAGSFAHAALVLGGVPQLKSYAGDLKNRAVRAFTYFQQHPKTSDCDNGSIKSGDVDRNATEQEQFSVIAAVYLFALTGEQTYAETIAKSYRVTRPMQEDRWSAYDPDQGDALLFYTTLPKADPAIKKAILDRKLEQAKTVDIYSTKPELDLYRAFMREDSFHWAHNMVRANVGNTNYDLLQLGLLKGNEATTARDRAEGLLHSFHGVNALGIVYLSNMYAYGAENSVNQIYHAWFKDGDPTYDDAKTSKPGPAPGYVPGGPSKQYCAFDPGAKCAGSRLRKQPAQKAYLDFNTAWAPDTEHDRSWEITEPGIYYQASYVKLLSKFVE